MSSKDTGLEGVGKEAFLIKTESRPNSTVLRKTLNVRKEEMFEVKNCSGVHESVLSPTNSFAKSSA